MVKSTEVLLLGLQVILLTNITHSFVLLTANMEDVRKLARKFVSESLAEQIADFIAKISSNGVANVSEENEKYNQVSENTYIKNRISKETIETEDTTKNSYIALNPKRHQLRKRPKIPKGNRFQIHSNQQAPVKGRSKLRDVDDKSNVREDSSSETRGHRNIDEPIFKLDDFKSASNRKNDMTMKSNSMWEMEDEQRPSMVQAELMRKIYSAPLGDTQALTRRKAPTSDESDLTESKEGNSTESATKMNEESNANTTKASRSDKTLEDAGQHEDSSQNHHQTSSSATTSDWINEDISQEKDEIHTDKKKQP